MRIYNIDKYLEYPKDKAYSFVLDEENLRVFRKFLVFLIIALGFFIIIVSSQGHVPLYLFLPVFSLNLLIALVLRIFYNKIFNINNIRKYLLIFLVIQFGFFLSGEFIEFVYPSYKTVQEQPVTNDNQASQAPQTSDSNSSSGDDDVNVNLSVGNERFSDLIFALLFLIVFFKFTRNDYILFFSIAILVPTILDLIFYQGLDAGTSIPGISISLMVFIVSVLVELKRYREFSTEYSYSYKKNFETIRMRKELASAREIQLSMLPQNNHKTSEFEIAGISLPATEVGGDYFDYFEISDTKIGLFICDVSGHGVASGLLLSGLRSCMHMILEDTSEPKIVMEKLNRMMRKTQNRKMFVTAVFAVVDLENNKCEFFNAGHLPPYKISGTTNEIFKIKKHSITLGAMDSIFEKGNDREVKFDFNKNDKLVLYTDGVNEAMNGEKHEYGFENIEKILYANTDKNANELLNVLVKDVEKFTNGSVQRDDLTILIIGRN